MFSLKNVSEPIEIFALSAMGLKVPKPEDLLSSPLPSKKEIRTKSRFKLVSARSILITAMVILFALILTYVELKNRTERAAEKLIFEIEDMAGEIQELNSIPRGKKAWEAYQLVQKVQETSPNHPELIKQWVPISRTLRLKTEPEGASVLIKPYSLLTEPWRLIGQSQIDSMRIPFGTLRIKIEKEGYAVQEDVIADRIQWMPQSDVKLQYKLIDASSIPEGMVMAKGSPFDNIPLDYFFIDQFEVSNKSYKEFVDAGGYAKKEFWVYDFIMNEHQLEWKEAINYFKDQTDQPGPATWIAGSYPDGEGNFPVGGISWYEAAAYAQFAGKMLPTIHHFRSISDQWSSAEVINFSNFLGKGPHENGASQSVSRYGVYDKLGNVREWCFNATYNGNRLIVGGSWKDMAYAVNDNRDIDAFDRNEINGLRCILPYGDEPIADSLLAPIEHFLFDMSMRHPLTDDQFDVIRRLYDYDEMELGAHIIYQHERENWNEELVKISTAYGDSMNLYLFIPKNVKPPYQAVIIAPLGVPGGSEHFIRSHWMNAYDFIVRTGRIMVLPIVYNTSDRPHKGHQNRSWGLITYKEINIKKVKDLKRTMDYLLSLKDIQQDKVAFYGVSAGGGGGSLVMAIEDRLSTAVFVVSGLSTRIEKLPETDRANYLPRISKPILMLNSKYDWNYPYETSQKPFFDLIGTPEKDKKMILYEESGHQLPWKAVMKETLKWYDQYLGKVKIEVVQTD